MASALHLLVQRWSKPLDARFDQGCLTAGHAPVVARVSQIGWLLCVVLKHATVVPFMSATLVWNQQTQQASEAMQMQQYTNSLFTDSIAVEQQQPSATHFRKSDTQEIIIFPAIQCFCDAANVSHRDMDRCHAISASQS